VPRLMSGYAGAPGTRGRQRIAGLLAHQKPLCLPGNALPAPCPPPGFAPAIPLLTFFPLALPDRNAYNIFCLAMISPAALILFPLLMAFKIR